MRQFDRLLAVLLLLLACISGHAQPEKKESKPYTVHTAGRQITIKSNKAIQHIMLWTTDGHRVIEQKGINQTHVRVDIPVYRKAFFLMIGLTNGKVYTEKIGLW
jgi:hypothetical protein